MCDDNQDGKVGGRLRLRIIQIRNSQPLNLVLRSGAFEGYLFWVYAMGWAVEGKKAPAEDDAKKARGSFVMLVL